MLGTSNKKWNQIFAFFFLRKWREYEIKKAIAEKGIGDDDYILDLIRELKKPFFLEKGNVYNRRRSIYRRNSVDFLSIDNNFPENIRNPNICHSILQRIQGLKEFCSINSISNESIFNIIPFISLQFFPKNSQIFKFGDSSKHFYCILSGKVSIRFPKEENLKNLNKNKLNNLSNYQKDSNPKRISSEINLIELHKKYKEIEDFTTYDSKSLKSYLKIKKLSVFEYYNKLDDIDNSKKSKSNINFANKSIKNANYNQSDINDYNHESNKPNENANFNDEKDENSHQVKSDENEVEKFVLDKGKCFGDWGLVYNQPRTASAVAAQETYCFTLMKEIFDEHFGKFILKAETDRRNFFREKLHILKDAVKFDEYYKRIIVMIANSNQILYLEGDPGKTVYLMYQGELALEKNLYIKSKHNSDGYSLSRKSNTVIKLASGAFAGMEVFCVPNSKYKYTLRTVGALNVIYKITLDDIPEFRDSIKDFMAEMNQKQNKILENLISEKQKIKKLYDKIFKSETEIKSPIKSQLKIANSNNNEFLINTENENFENFCMRFPTIENNFNNSNLNSASNNSNNYENFESSNSLKKISNFNYNNFDPIVSNNSNTRNERDNRKNESDQKCFRSSSTLKIEEDPFVLSPLNKFNSTSFNFSKIKKSNEINEINNIKKNDFFITKSNLSFKKSDSIFTTKNTENKKVSFYAKSTERLKNYQTINLKNFKKNKNEGENLSLESFAENKLISKVFNNSNSKAHFNNDSYATAEETQCFYPSQQNLFSDFNPYANSKTNTKNSKEIIYCNQQQPSKKVLANKLVYCSSLRSPFKGLEIKEDNNELKYFEPLIFENNKKSNNYNNNYSKTHAGNKISKIEPFAFHKNNKNEKCINKKKINNIIEAQKKREDLVLKTPLKNCVNDWKNLNQRNNQDQNNKKLFYRTSFFNLPLISNLNVDKNC